MILPQPSGASHRFSLPIIDVERAKERLKREVTAEDMMLVSLTNTPGMFSQQSLLNVEYIGESGRRHTVELGHFYWGNSEVQNWRNYIVCAQAQADTGKKPYGPWKSLPTEEDRQIEGAAETVPSGASPTSN